MPIPGTTNFPTALDTDFTLLLQANDVSSLLNGGITDSATTLTVVSAASFPAAGVVRLEDEFIIYESKTGTTLDTLTRGAFGSTAAAHTTGANVKMTLAAVYHNVHTAAIEAMQGKLGIGSSIAAANQVLLGTGTGVTGFGQVTNAYIASGAAIALSKLAITGTPDGTKFLRDDATWQAVAGGISALTGDVTASGSGSVAATLANTAVTPGSYTSADITVDSKGRITAAANGSGGGSGANAALSNLASVAINTALLTGAGIAAAFTATIPTVAATSTAGAAASLSASDAIAGNVTAGAANGGGVTITAGDAKRLTSGNANGGTITLTAGLKIGTGNDGQVLLSKTGTEALPGLAIGATDQGVSVVSGAMIFSLGATGRFSAYTNGLRVASGGRYEFSSDSSAIGTPDILLSRFSANVMRIGGNAAGNTPGRLIIGRSDDSALTSGALMAFTETSTTNAIVDSVRLCTNSTSAGANNFGGRLSLSAHTTTTKDQIAAAIDWQWSTATHASRTSDLIFSTVNSTTLAEAFRLTGAGLPVFPTTNTAAGTTGAQTINKASGSVNFAAAASSLVVTNSLVTANSIVICTVLTNDGTAQIKNCVPTAGSFTITLASAATAETRVGFWVINK